VSVSLPTTGGTSFGVAIGAGSGCTVAGDEAALCLLPHAVCVAVIL